jgi:TonB family protein
MESNPSPAYPEEARRNGVQGTVVARIVVETGGRVGQVEILSGPEELHDTVLRTLRRWRFRPATLEGRPVSVQRIVRIPFRLETVGRG